jgi:hypothetical protein
MILTRRFVVALGAWHWAPGKTTTKTVTHTKPFAFSSAKRQAPNA